MEIDNQLHKAHLDEYSTHQLAEFSKVCVNTVRNYEKYGFLSKSKRAENGYRIFTDIHKLQIMICRLVFSPPYINTLIRKASREVVFASAQEDFVLCKEQTEKYIGVIENELKKINDAVKALANFCKPDNMNIYYDRKEAADIIGTTAETIRNWERNGLIKSIKRNKKSIYNQTELDIMRLIYTLLIAGFNIQKVLDSLIFLREDDKEKAVEALCESDSYLELVNIEENIIKRIKEVLASAYKIKEILEKNI